MLVSYNAHQWSTFGGASQIPIDAQPWIMRTSGLDLEALGATLLGRLDDRLATGTTKLIVVSAFVFALPPPDPTAPTLSGRGKAPPTLHLQRSEIAG